MLSKVVAKASAASIKFSIGDRVIVVGPEHRLATHALGPKQLVGWLGSITSLHPVRVVSVSLDVCDQYYQFYEWQVAHTITQELINGLKDTRG